MTMKKKSGQVSSFFFKKTKKERKEERHVMLDLYTVALLVCLRSSLQSSYIN